VSYLALAILLAVAPPAEARHVPDEIMVRFAPGAAEDEARRALDGLGAREVRQLPQVRVRLVKLPPGLTVEAAIERLQRNPNVLSAEPNHIFKAKALPTDQFFPLQWSLDRISASQSWASDVPGADGSSSVVIAIADSGIDASHPDVAGKLVTGYNAFDGSSNAQDDNGHGTAVASIAAGTANNGGVVGVCRNAKLMPVKVLDDEGGGSEFGILDGILWAANHGADVINMSLGSCNPECEPPTEAARSAAVQVWSLGVVLVAAAGNESTTEISYPAGYPHVLGVGATDPRDRLTYYSNMGPALDVVAPGGSGTGTLYCDPYEDLLAAALTAPAYCPAPPFSYYDPPDERCACQYDPLPGTYPGGTTFFLTAAGTSGACPVVAGLAAVILGLHPDWTPDQVMSQIESTADPMPGQSGWSPDYGYGRVNMLRALQGNTVAPPLSTSPAWVYPNPFRPVNDLFVTFVIPAGRGAVISIEIRDTSGVMVWKMSMTAAETAGLDLYYNSPVRWDGKDLKGRNVANGIYSARIKAGASTCVKRIVVAR